MNSSLVEFALLLPSDISVPVVAYVNTDIQSEKSFSLVAATMSDKPDRFPK